MKRKGFTLIELLAVIVILAVIALITIPIIGNIIENSKKKALEQSVYGIVESANYFAISNDGIYEFLFDENKKGKTKEGDYALDYKGNVDVEGSLYVDDDGNVSLCLMNENYYVYKNYNSGIYVGNTSEDTCIIGYDVLTNKYVAMLDDGSGTVSNVYSKSEVDSLVSNLQEQITMNKSNIDSMSSIVNTNTTDIATLQENVNTISDNMENKYPDFSKYYFIGALEMESSALEIACDISQYKAFYITMSYGSDFVDSLFVPVNAPYVNSTDIRYWLVGKNSTTEFSASIGIINDTITLESASNKNVVVRINGYK